MADADSRTGTSYLTRPILDYLAATHAPHDEGLARAFAAPEHQGLPAIQVGPSEGKLLTLLLRLAGARKVVEVGTLAGYSAIHLARALPPEGHLWTIEFDENHAKVARENLAAAGLSSRVTVVQGAGLDVLPTLEPHGPFDAVFIDADKVNYDGYGRWAARNLRPGGLLLGDNAVYFGRLLEDSDAAPAMRRFHEEAAAHFDTVCIPTPDGLLLGVKR
jgi:caffeoyl-CoA O-methyltransferase